MQKSRTVILGGLLGWIAISAVASGKSATSPLTPVPQVDLERYSGRWYEIARLPNRFQDDCSANVTADYALREDGLVSVVNRCTALDGRRKQAQGVARIVDEVSRSKLEVRFAPAFLSFIPAVWGDYWIIDLAPDYDYAVVGEPRRRYLWILARAPHLDEETFQAVLLRLRRQGYDTTRLIHTSHED